MTADALLMLEVEDVRRVLEGSPHPFASDPEAKRKGMGAFQPDALTISRDGLWDDRRRFTEAVLDTPQPVHRHGEHFAAVAKEETAAMLDSLEDGELDYEALLPPYRRIVRRIVLGDSARDDEELSDMLAMLMSKGNGMPDEPPEELRAVHGEDRRVRRGRRAGQPGGSVRRGAVDPRHQARGPGDALAVRPPGHDEHEHAAGARGDRQPPRQRAKLADEPSPYLNACLQDAMRLWPTTPLLSRETVEDVEWHGATVPAGTQLMIVNTFHHRDPDRVPYADRFAPEEWIDGDGGR